MIVNLIKISRIAKFVDKDSKMKLVHRLFSIIDLCNSLYYSLSNINLNGLQMLIKSAAKIVVGFLRFSRERIIHVCFDLHVLSIK